MILNAKIKKYFLALLLTEMFLMHAGLALAAEPYNYAESGVAASIKKYLCAPTDVSGDKNPEEKGPREGKVDRQEEKEIQFSSGERNKAQYDLYTCINRIYKFAIITAGVIAIFFIVIAGYIYMSSDGSQESVDKAKSILTSSVTAIVILFAGYILLRALNPDLIKFQNIQPPSVALQKFTKDQPVSVRIDAEGNLIGVTGGASHKETELEMGQDGCVFQSDAQKKEIQNLTEIMFKKVKDLCFNVRASLKKKLPANKTIAPKISSVIGGPAAHAKNSYHYKGCAVDFADNNQNFTQTEPGLTIIEEAKKIFPPDRINPGTDAKQTYHIHVDLGNQCPTK